MLYTFMYNNYLVFYILRASLLPMDTVVVPWNIPLLMGALLFNGQYIFLTMCMCICCLCRLSAYVEYSEIFWVLYFFGIEYIYL